MHGPQAPGGLCAAPAENRCGDATIRRETRDTITGRAPSGCAQAHVRTGRTRGGGCACWAGRVGNVRGVSWPAPPKKVLRGRWWPAGSGNRHAPAPNSQTARGAGQRGDGRARVFYYCAPAHVRAETEM